MKSRNDSQIVAESDGILIMWQDGILSTDDRTLTKKIKQASRVGAETKLSEFGPTVEADLSYAVGAAAAILLGNPGRVQFVSLPQKVVDVLPPQTGEEETIFGDYREQPENEENSLYV